MSHGQSYSCIANAAAEPAGDGRELQSVLVYAKLLEDALSKANVNEDTMTRLITVLKNIENFLVEDDETLDPPDKKDEGAAPPSVKGERDPSLDQVDAFDPNDPDLDVERWIRKVDQVGEVHGWTDYDKAYCLQEKLVGAAREWYGSLPGEVLFQTWDEWCSSLREAFCDARDFAETLKELVGREKTADETFKAYFEAKLSLCKQCRIYGKNAVSCIVSGLPADLKSAVDVKKYRTPLELYENFLVTLEGKDESSPSTQTYLMQDDFDSGTNNNLPRPFVHGRKISQCYNCQKYTTHRSRECPEPRRERCKICRKVGHVMTTCRFFRGRGRGFRGGFR